MGEGKTKMAWTIGIGPYAEHVISIERKYKTNRTMTLTVDGSTLVEAKARDFDIDYDGDDDEDEARDPPWVCKFYFIGERSVKVKVNEESKAGMVLDSTDLVEAFTPEKRRFKKACTVTIGNPRDLRQATLKVDDILFEELKAPRKQSDGGSIVLEPEILQMQYGVAVPKKVRQDAPPGLAGIHQKWMEGVENVQTIVDATQKDGFGGFLQSVTQSVQGKGAGKGRGGYSS